MIIDTKTVTMTNSAPGDRPLLVARKARIIYLLTCTFLLLLLPARSDCSLVASSQPAAAAAITASVNGALSVERGGRSLIDLNDLLNITTNTNNTDTNTTSITSCSLTYLNNAAQCGHVWPETVNCSEDSPPTLAYTHYGCFNQYEMLNFRILHELTVLNTTTMDLTTIATYITELSMSVQILQATAPLLEVSVDDSNEDKEIAVHCPHQYIGQCSYTISSKRSADFMSNGSTLTGHWMDKPIPCGYSPRIPFLYEPASQLQLPFYDAISVETNCVSNEQGQYSLLIINSSSSALQYQEPFKLPNSYLRIKELAVTPIDAHLLNISHFVQDNHHYKLTFPVLTIGGLYPVYSAKRGYLDTTVFTYSDIVNGHVVFVPDETSAITYITIRSQYHYFLSDVTGRVVAKGMLEVTISPRVGLKPSLRRNTGFSLLTGGTAEINGNHLDFYPPSKCLDYTITITKPPISGVLYYSNSTRPLTTDDQISVMDGNISLSYTHTDNKASHDAVLASVLCHKYKEPLSIMIPVRIIGSTIPRLNNCTQTLYGYSGYATSLTPWIRHCIHTSSGITVSDSQSLANLFVFNDSCNSTSFHGYPYIDQSDYSLSNCFLPVTSQQLSSNQWTRLWYVASNSINNNNSSSTLYLSADASSVPIIVEFTIINLLTTQQGDFESLIVSDNAVYSNIHPLQPFLRHNSLLTISSPDSTVITSHYLYVQSIGYLQQEIVYQVTSSPQYGLLCLLRHLETCTASVSNFTQEDVLSDRLYYKPLLDVQSASQDEFTFEVYFLSDVKLEGHSRFEIRLAYVDEEEKEFKQFWVNFGRTKVLARRYLKHLKNSISAPFDQLNFILLSPPSLGELVNFGPIKGNFTGEDIMNRSVEYHHKKERGCSDRLHLAVEHKGKIVLEVNITVAIRNKRNSSLQISTKQHELEGGESFVLSLNDLTVNTGFCPEFIRVIIREPPNYGRLIAQDSTHHNKRYLSTNASFIASDISNSFISYQLLPDVALIEDTQDDFLFSIVDPRGEFEEPSLKRSTNSPPNVFHIFIIIIPPEGSGLAYPFNLTSTSSKQVTPLSDGKYGATLGPKDLYLTNTDLLPSEVHFIIHQAPLYGHILKNNRPTEEFTLADINSGNISYIQTLPHVDSDIMNDEFRYSIFINLYDTQQRITLDHGFSFNWCYFAVDLGNGPFSSDFGNGSFTSVQEIQSTVGFTIRKLGAIDKSDEASVRVSAVPGNNHTIVVNCSQSVKGSIHQPLTDEEQPDYCELDERINFSGKKTKHRASITLFDDNIPEGFEPIEIRLSEPVGCVVPKLLNPRIFINDGEDYSIDVGFSADSYSTSSSNSCLMRFDVKENIGTFNLTLTRSGNLGAWLGVICHTDINLDEDYIDRPLHDTKSIVYFEPGKDHTHCPITIVNDQLNEKKEQFYVNLTVLVGEFGFLDTLKKSLCVFIDHDINDESVVFFKKSIIRIKESFIGPVTDYYFTIIRSGVDLSKKTELGNFYITPKGNATFGVDYVTEESLSFLPWETELNVRITVINDNVSEGPENFFLQLTEPFLSRLGSPSKLEVIITDPTKDVVIGFQSKEFVFQETVGFASVPFYRHGDLSRSTIVSCVVTFLTLDESEVLTPLPVTLSPNVSRGECKFFIINDDNREKVESLRVTLATDDLSVQLENNTAIVKVVDPEDAPHVSFNKPLNSIREPLSNNPVDFTSIKLKVTIKGQNLTNTSVCYHTINGTAKSGINYHHTEGQVLLNPSDSIFTINVVILSNRRSTIGTVPNRWFTVELFTCTHGNSVFLAAPHNTTRVIIKSTFVGGAFFPALPSIHSLIQNDIKYVNSTTEGLLIASYSDPTICLTPCDSEHPNYLENIKECDRQDINPRLTRYKWEWSSDSTTFYPIELETLLTTVDSRVLQSVYFDKGVWLRCKSTAVNSAGMEGYTRTSLAVFLNTTTTPTDCQQNSNEGVKLNVSSELNSYAGYGGSEEDLLHLSVSIPNIPNHFPIITTMPPIDHAHSLLISSSTQFKYPCSTVSHYHEFLPPLTTRGDAPSFIMPNHHELLSELFFNSYNSTSCSWEFSSWLTLHTLRSLCLATISGKGQSVQLPLFIQYVRIVNNTIIGLPGIEEQSVSLTTGTSPSLVPVDRLPFDYLPINRTLTEPHPHKLRPIKLYYDEKRIQFVFKSLIVIDSLSDHKLFVEDTYRTRLGSTLDEHGRIHLLKTESSTVNGTTSVTQTWLMDEVTSRDNGELKIALKLCTFKESVTDRGNKCSGGHDDVFVYSIPWTRDNGSIRMGMNINGYAKQMSISQGSGVNTVIQTGVSLNPSLIPTLLPYPRLTVTKRVLCGSNPSLENSRCTYKQDIIPTIELEGMPLANDPLALVHYMNQSDTIIPKSPSGIQWYFRITVSLQFGAGLSITQELFIPIQSPHQYPTTVSTTESLVSGVEPEIPIYASVLISIMMAALTIVMAMTGLIICYSLRRRYDLKKLEIEAAMQEAKWSAMEKERRYQKEQSKIITSYKKRRSERRHRQLLMEHTRLPDNEEAMLHLQTVDDNVCIKPHPHPGLIGPVRLVSTTLLNDHSHSLKSTPPSRPVIRTTDDITDSNCLAPETENKSKDIISSPTPIATVKPLPKQPSPKQPSLPYHTLSTLLPLRKSTLLPLLSTSVTSATSAGDQTTNGGLAPTGSCGWYDRHLARKKAMNSYVELYLGSKPSSPGNEQQYVKKEELNTEDSTANVDNMSNCSSDVQEESIL